MKKRDFTTAFENDNHIDTGLSLDEAVHGAAPKLDTGRIVTRPISIFEIYPDPTQPRRAIPSSVRQGWDGSPVGVPEIIDTWMNAAKEESKGQFNLGAYLHDEGVPDQHRKIGSIELALLKLLDVARSIKQDELTNPITVVPYHSVYRLETGERRWLAYHLLRSELPHEDKWLKIPARVVDTPNLWRQAAENSARDNLNAIAKARQYALLVMDLWRNDPDTPVQFEPFDAFENEREFYAQVVGDKVNRAPSGQNHLILSAMGISSRGSLSFYKRFLTLPDEVWQIGDDYNLPEEVLYRLAKMDAKAGIAEARKIVLAQNNSEGGKRQARPVDVEYAPGTKRYFAQTMQLLKDAKQGKQGADESALERIQEMRNWLDEEERQIKSSLKGRQ